MKIIDKLLFWLSLALFANMFWYLAGTHVTGRFICYELAQGADNGDEFYAWCMENIGFADRGDLEVIVLVLCGLIVFISFRLMRVRKLLRVKRIKEE